MFDDKRPQIIYQNNYAELNDQTMQFLRITMQMKRTKKVADQVS